MQRSSWMRGGLIVAAAMAATVASAAE